MTPSKETRCAEGRDQPGRIPGEREKGRTLSRMRVVSLAQIRIVAVHRADEVADPGVQDRVQASGETTEFADEFGREVGQYAPSVLGSEVEKIGRNRFLPLFLVENHI